MKEFIRKRVRALRLEKDLSKKEMAFALEIDYSTYSRLESGAISSWMKYIPRICTVFSIPEHEFMQGSSEILSERKSIQANLNAHEKLAAEATLMLAQNNEDYESYKRAIEDLKFKIVVLEKLLLASK